MDYGWSDLAAESVLSGSANLLCFFKGGNMTKHMDNNKIIDVASLNEGRKGNWKKFIYLLVAIAISGGIFLSVLDGSSDVKSYKTHFVQAGNFSMNVAASGTLQPRNKVIVGCEISGTIDKIYKDYNDKVAKGELLVRLRTDELQARVHQLRAALESARARVQKSRVDLKDKKNECMRMSRLRSKNAVSQKKLDSAVTGRDMAMAHLSESKALVRQAEATLMEAEANLKKTSITSPINGLVLTRHVEAGQAVSSGMNTPQLYTLATNLQDMRLELNIDEADVGKIKPGQKAVFSVDAYAGRKFYAEFIKLRYAPQRVQGVVTYVGIFSVNNTDLSLRPGMTASAKIEIKKIQNKLVIPNAALRFVPVGYESVLPDHNSNTADIWILRNGRPDKLEINKGDSNGRFTEIIGGNLRAGDEVVLSVVDKKDENSFSVSF